MEAADTQQEASCLMEPAAAPVSVVLSKLPLERYAALVSLIAKQSLDHTFPSADDAAMSLLQLIELREVWHAACLCTSHTLRTNRCIAESSRPCERAGI